MLSQENFEVTVIVAFLERFCIKFESSRSIKIALATLSGLESTKMPSKPSVIISGNHPSLDAITGLPAIIASKGATGQASFKEI